MKLTVNITSITIITTAGTDEICLHTDLPTPYPADVSDRPADFKLVTAKGWAKAYVAEHFPGIKVKIIAV